MNFLRRFGPVGFIAVHVEILVLCGTLLAAFGVQFFEGEMPCPLCILQRLAMMISAMGTAFIVVRWKEGRLAQADYMTGHGMILLAALAGAAISTRHILLHISPPDPGYGSPVFGLHLYTWALIVFLCLIGTSGIAMVFGDWLIEGQAGFGWWSQAVVCLLAVVILANTLVIICEQGFHFLLPSDPQRYELFHDLGLQPTP